MDDELLTPADIERRAIAAGLTLKELCSRAGIAQSTFWRWRAKKTGPTLAVYRRIRDVLAENTQPTKSTIITSKFSERNRAKVNQV